MKVSFSGNYIMRFKDSESKNKALKYFFKRSLDELKTIKHISDMNESVPVVRNLPDNDILILTNKDAKDYYTMSKLNGESNPLRHPIKKFINDTYFECALTSSYIKSAKVMKFDIMQTNGIDIFA